MAAPILWAPGTFGLFILEDPHFHKIHRFREEGGFWKGRGECQFYSYGARGFFWIFALESQDDNTIGAKIKSMLIPKHLILKFRWLKSKRNRSELLLRCLETEFLLEFVGNGGSTGVERYWCIPRSAANNLGEIPQKWELEIPCFKGGFPGEEDFGTRHFLSPSLSGIRLYFVRPHFPSPKFVLLRSCSLFALWFKTWARGGEPRKVPRSTF